MRACKEAAETTYVLVFDLFKRGVMNSCQDMFLLLDVLCKRVSAWGRDQRSWAQAGGLKGKLTQSPSNCPGSTKIAVVLLGAGRVFRRLARIFVFVELWILDELPASKSCFRS